MHARSVLLSLVCLVGLLGAGCSAQVAGSPQAATGGSVAATSAVGATDGGSAGSSVAANTGSSAPADLSSSTPAAGTGLSDLTLSTGALPTDLADLTNLTNVPGFSSGCLAAAGIAMGFGMMMLGPTLGGTAVTAKDVNEAFAALSNVPPELKDVVDVLHKAAVAATGQPLAKAADILGSPEVTKAMDKLSAYTDANCGG